MIERIAALVPPARTHRHRYCGVLAPNSPLRAAVTAMAQATLAPLAPSVPARSPVGGGGGLALPAIAQPEPQSEAMPPKHSPAHYLVALMAGQFAQAPGNYLAFFSSFDYLKQAADALTASHPCIPVWLQGRSMDEPARDAFLAHFTLHSQGIGFVVLGGAFGEGIDLPGKRLIGAFIATLGMPQVNPVNEQIRHRMQACLGRGYDYTYLFPGIQKVVQAAGRVIRTPQDMGVVFLMDDRFARAEVKALFPSWWRVELS